MPSKTISIDLEAYKRLQKLRHKDESMSETIKRVVKPPVDIDRWLEEVRRSPLSSKAVQAIESHVNGRRQRRSRLR